MNSIKKVLIFAWEYEGYHSQQGAALSRRIKQVAGSFANNNWEVTVIHKDRTNECGEYPYLINKLPNGITRIVVKNKDLVSFLENIPLIRKIETFYYVLIHGDRSYRWALKVMKHFDEFNITRPDLIISFFTPRAPLVLGNFYSKKFNTKWIADLQDEFDAGISNSLRKINVYWTKKILKTAKAIVYVSPEWALRDTKILGIKINTIRHAIPLQHLIDNTPKYEDGPEFNIFYGGSLSESGQSLAILKLVLESLTPQGIKIVLTLAGNERVYNRFNKELGKIVCINYLGWLDSQNYISAILKCNCILVIPWSLNTRQVIPSKFYELCSFNKPIWIIGNCTGSFKILLNEWRHPKILFDDIDYQKNAINLALISDYSKMFNIQKCLNEPMYESGLFYKYIDLL